MELHIHVGKGRSLPFVCVDLCVSGFACALEVAAVS